MSIVTIGALIATLLIIICVFSAATKLALTIDTMRHISKGH